MPRTRKAWECSLPGEFPTVFLGQEVVNGNHIRVVMSQDGCVKIEEIVLQRLSHSRDNREHIRILRKGRLA